MTQKLTTIAIGHSVAFKNEYNWYCIVSNKRQMFIKSNEKKVMAWFYEQNNERKKQIWYTTKTTTTEFRHAHTE